jgi:hypothetical protein
MLKENILVNHPPHYTSDPSGIECIDIVKYRDFCIGNAIKYLWRAGLKKDSSISDKEKEIEDLEKAIWYINKKIEMLKKENARNVLSALLADTDEKNPMNVDIILETSEDMGLSTLQKPHVIKVFQDPKEGIMWMLFEGADDYIEIEEDDEMEQIINYINNNYPISTETNKIINNYYTTFS